MAIPRPSAGGSSVRGVSLAACGGAPGLADDDVVRGRAGVVQDPVDDHLAIGAVVVAVATAAGVADAPRGHGDDRVAVGRPEHRAARVTAAGPGAALAVA